MEAGSVEALLRSNPVFGSSFANLDSNPKFDNLDPMQNQLCRVCEEPAAGFHFGAFTCEGCKSFFGRTCNNQSVIQECKNNYRCVVDKKNRTACKACRLRKCIMVGMSKSGSRYGRRSNWFKIHCLMQQNIGGSSFSGRSFKTSSSYNSSSSQKERKRHENGKEKIENEDKNPSLLHLSSVSASGGNTERLPQKSEARGSPSPSSSSKSESPGYSTSSSLSSPSLGASCPLTSSSSSPMFLGGFPLSLLNPSRLAGLSFHHQHHQRQALLSPILAQSQLAWHVTRNSLFRPDGELMSEHQALLERFASTALAAAAAAAAASSSSPSSSPALSSSKTPSPPQQLPMDLTNKKLENSDVNKNVISASIDAS